MPASYNDRVKGLLPPIIVLPIRQRFSQCQHPFFSDFLGELDRRGKLNKVAVLPPVEEAIDPFPDDLTASVWCIVVNYRRLGRTCELGWKGFLGVAHNSGINVAFQAIVDGRICQSCFKIIDLGIGGRQGWKCWWERHSHIRLALDDFLQRCQLGCDFWMPNPARARMSDLPVVQ